MRLPISRFIAAALGICGAVASGIPAYAATTSAGAALQIAHPDNSTTQTVRGVRRESVDHEAFSAGPGELTEIVFADGSSVTLASGAKVVIDAFHYDRATHTGELVMRVETGLVRVVGGVLNNTNAIRAILPQGEARIDNGIATVDVAEGHSDVALLLGKSISVTANGQTTTITQAHTVTRVSGNGVEGTQPQTDAQGKAYLALLNPGLVSGVAPRFVADDTTEEQTNASDRIFAALTTAKDADVNANVQNSIPPPTDTTPPPDNNPPDNPPNNPPDNPPPPPPPTLDNVALNLPSQNAAALGGLNWTANTNAIGDIGAPGSDSANSVFYFFLQDRATLHDNPSPLHATSVMFGGDQQGELTGGVGEARRNGDISHTEGQASDYECDPSCGYAFTAHRTSIGPSWTAADVDTDVNGKFLFRSNYLGILAPGLTTGPQHDPPDYGQGGTNDYLFRYDFDEKWTLPGAGAIAFQRSTDPSVLNQDGDSIINKTPTAQKPTDKYFLQSGFTTVAFQVKYSAPVGGTCTGGAIAGPGGADVNPAAHVRNTGCFTITGLGGTGPDPCPAGAGGDACRNLLIDHAHNLMVDGDNGSPFSFTDGSQREDNGNTDDEFNITQSGGTTYDLYLVIRNDDNHFLAYEANTTSNTDNQHFLYASGAVTRSPAAKSQATLDKFLLSPGTSFFVDVNATGALDANATTAANTAANTKFTDAQNACRDGNCALSARAFLRNATLPTALNGKLYDSGLLVFNPANSDTSSVFHTDFALSGSGADQVSTVTGLFGNLTYTDADHSAALKSALVGSTYGPGTNNPSLGITALSSAIVSSAAGGGNPLLSSTHDQTPVDTDGDTRAGYLVLETGDALTPGARGTETPVNSTDNPLRFSSARLATGVSTSLVPESSRVSAATTTQGYLAGLQIADGNGNISRISELGADFTTSPNFELTRDPAANTVVGKVIGDNAWTAGQQLGGTNENSSYIDETRYGAADGAKAGIISGNAVMPGWQGGSGGLDARDPTTNSNALLDQLKGYQYLQWGFFFGDSSPQRNGSQYAHLASWVTGKLTALDAPKPTGTATYEGHMIGNVASVNGTTTSYYTAIGTFTNSWNFNVRQGDVTMKFDGVNDYTGHTIFRGDTLNADKTAFTGTNNGQFVGSVSSGTSSRSGVLNGSFINKDANTTHVGVIGRFDIGSSDGKYTASGTFGGEKKTPP